MAYCYPPFEEINKLRQKPSSGEYFLLDFLCKNLGESFEIYFNPYLDGNRPDIIIMRKGYGVLIIEVKDWFLNFYNFDISTESWSLKKDCSIIQSPLNQVENYKKNLYDLHMEDLGRVNIINQKAFSIVQCAVYFHNASTNEVNSFMQNKKYKYTHIFGNDINETLLHGLMDKCYLSNFHQKKSTLFTDTLYDSFKRFLHPPMHAATEGVDVEYNEIQRKIIQSERKMLRIKGVMGSGKTLVLARKAVESYKKHRGDVLILTYNISLRNYIKEQINKVRENFPWNAFTFLNYHTFINIELNNLGVPIQECKDDKELDTKYYSNKYLFGSLRSHKNFKVYNTILIDEVQDFKRTWLDIIKDFFLADDGEYFLFGDEKQRIYDNSDFDETFKDIRTNVPGRPMELKHCYRSSDCIKQLALKFQRMMFCDKYDTDDFKNDETERTIADYISRSEFLKYFYYETMSDAVIEKINGYIIHCAEEYSINPNDITIIGLSVETLRKLDKLYKAITRAKTSKTFEDEEEYKILRSKYNESKSLEWAINKIRRRYKYNFFSFPGMVKIASIYSYKGFQNEWIFLIIDNKKINLKNDDEQALNINELIYVGITRSRANLVIFNIGHNEYDKKLGALIKSMDDHRS